jgi:hypothetical protein
MIRKVSLLRFACRPVTSDAAIITVYVPSGSLALMILPLKDFVFLPL